MPARKYGREERIEEFASTIFLNPSANLDFMAQLNSFSESHSNLFQNLDQQFVLRIPKIKKPNLAMKYSRFET